MSPFSSEPTFRFNKPRFQSFPCVPSDQDSPVARRTFPAAPSSKLINSLSPWRGPIFERRSLRLLLVRFEGSIRKASPTQRHLQDFISLQSASYTAQFQNFRDSSCSSPSPVLEISCFGPDIEHWIKRPMVVRVASFAAILRQV